jgi:hypothetical protein
MKKNSSTLQESIISVRIQELEDRVKTLESINLSLTEEKYELLKQRREEIDIYKSILQDLKLTYYSFGALDPKPNRIDMINQFLLKAVQTINTRIKHFDPEFQSNIVPVPGGLS